MSESEAGIQERAIIVNILQINMGSLDNLLVDIYAGNFPSLGSLLYRSELWQNSAANAYFQGMLQRKDDPYLAWRRNPLKDSCDDCIRLNGQVHRASEWLASGWVPRSSGLQCRGFNCGCSFIASSGPSRGSF